jgi:pimeloyl-ACP methyl ester carboxylesterase
VRRKDASPVPKLPVLIANGFAPFPLPLDVAVARYRRRGYDIRIVPFRMDDMRDTRRFARHIADEAEAIAGDDQVNLLGLSMGGVAALYALKRLGIAPRVAVSVSVGAPFLGSLLSWFALPTGIFTRTGLQLSPGSRFLEKLHGDPLPSGPDFVSIAGRDDAVCPPDTALLPGARHVVEPFGHADLFLDRRLHDVIVSHFR